MTHTFFVTGANGFIGQHLVRHLSSHGHDVFALIRPGSLPSFLIDERIHVCYGDLLNKESLMRAMPTTAYVINLAANPYHKTLSYDVNVGGTRHLLEVAKKKQCIQFVHISTQATKIATRGVYGTTKLKSDELVRQSGVPFVIIKPSLVYGPGEKGLFAKISKLASALPFLPVFGDGNTHLNPIHVQDLCSLLEMVSIDSSASGETFDAGGNERITYNSLYTTIGSYLPKQPRLIHIPKTIGLLIAKAMSVLPNPPFYEDNILGSTQETRCHPQPLLKRYHHTPTSFNTGVREVFAPKRIRVGIIGLGKMGMLHATLLRLMPQVEITALIDTNPKLFATFQSMGIPGNFYLSFHDALQHEKLDAVYIITPTFAHLPLLKEALQHDIHVFIEKPVTLNRQQVTELRKLHPKVIIHTGYTLLYHRPFQELMRMIKEKRYGTIRSYTATFQHGEVFAPKKGWMFTKILSGGGVLMNPGPHLFSLIQACFGKPKYITGKIVKKYSTEVEDEAQFSCIYTNMTGKISLSWSVAEKHVADYGISCVFEHATVTATSKGVLIQEKKKKMVSIPFFNLPQQEPNLFSINPSAYGEAYYMENMEFTRAIVAKVPKKVANSLNAALQTEDIIQTCYEKGVEQ